MKAKAKKIFKLLISTLFLLFLGLYITQALGYFDFNDNKKTVLTENAIERFEKDIKSGKKINAKDYIEEEKNYNNLLSKISLSLSNVIEKGFNHFMNAMFDEISKVTGS